MWIRGRGGRVVQSPPRVREDRGSNLRARQYIFRIPVKLSLNISRSHSDSENGWMDVRECTRAQLDEVNNYAGAITETFHRQFRIEAFHGPRWKIAQLWRRGWNKRSRLQYISDSR